jgi:hypothetical protein
MIEENGTKACCTDPELIATRAGSLWAEEFGQWTHVSFINYEKIALSY